MRIGVIENWRRIQGIGIRDTAKMIGVSPSTLSRVENGEKCDSETLSKILFWLLETEEPIRDFMGQADEALQA